MKRTDRDNFRVEYKGTINRDILPRGPLRDLTDYTTVAGVIYPRRLGDLGVGIVSDSMVSRDPASAYESRCKEIIYALRDLYGSALKAEILCDTEHTCSHCWHGWEELTQELLDDDPSYAEEPGDGPGLPLCCNAAQNEWRAQQAITDRSLNTDHSLATTTQER